MLDKVEDSKAIALDVMKSAMRSSSEVDGTVLNSILFHQGLHALVCHRLAHRLWNAKRTGLAYYIQSTVSRKYSTDIHPAAQLGCGVYLNAGSAGVVIGETAVVDHDVTILQGVTLGGTGKERGDRHPKVRRGAILQQSCSVLGNIEVGEGAIVTAKSIVTKPVPAFARVSGVPGKVKSYVETAISSIKSDDSEDNNESKDEKESTGLYGREVFEDTDELSDLERIMMEKYLKFWKDIEDENESKSGKKDEVNLSDFI
jgi:serine O-acetyltransferase